MELCNSIRLPVCQKVFWSIADCFFQCYFLLRAHVHVLQTVHVRVYVHVPASALEGIFSLDF